MHENCPPLSFTEIENLVTTIENDVTAEEQLSLECLVASPTVDFAGDAENCAEAPSCSGGNGGDLDNYAYEQSCLASILSGYYPTMDASIFSPLIEAEPALSGAQSEILLDYSSEPMTVDALQYSPVASMGQLLEPPTVPLQMPLPHCHPQQSLMQPYVGDERFMHMAHDLMAGMQYQNMAAAAYDLQNATFQQYALQYSPAAIYDHAQLLMDTQVEKQQNNSSLVAVCSGSSCATLRLPEISTMDDSTFKVGSLTPEEKREKIHKFMKKRNERNFNKKIKYACRKTLADSRPRVRGRFAKNKELGEATRIRTGDHDYEDGDEVKDEEGYDSSDILAHITGVNSFKRSSNTEPWTI